MITSGHNIFISVSIKNAAFLDIRMKKDDRVVVFLSDFEKGGF